MTPSILIRVSLLGLMLLLSACGATDLSSEKSIYGANEAVQLNYSVGKNTSSRWVGVFEAGQLNSSCENTASELAKQNTQGLQGSLYFDPLPPGNYVGQLFEGGGYCHLGEPAPFQVSDNEVEPAECEPGQLVLNLRIHIMRDITFHVQGASLHNDHITPDVVRSIIVPELNNIWAQGNIFWQIEQILEEDVIKGDDFEVQKQIVEEAVRDENGHADPARLVPLYGFQNPNNRSNQNELDGNLYHIYIYPFIGNTSQGNAMRSYGFHTVVGAWSNKFNGGGVPVKSPLVGDWDNFQVGSLSRTIAHELGHVLGLKHSQCSDCLMKGRGYGITPSQVDLANDSAVAREAVPCSEI